MTAGIGTPWTTQRAVVAALEAGVPLMEAAPFTGRSRFEIMEGGIVGWWLDGRLTADLILRHVMDDTVSIQFVQSGGGRRRITAHGSERHGGGTLYIGLFPAGSRQVRRWRAGRPIRYAAFWIPPTHAAVALFPHRADRLPAFTDLLDGRLAAPFGLSVTMTPAMHAVMDALIDGPPRPTVLARAYETLKLRELMIEAAGVMAAAAAPRRAADGVPAQTRHEMQIERAAEILRRELADPPGFRELARRVGISHNRLAAGFVARFGCTPHEYGKRQRMQAARRLIREGRHGLIDVAALVGFSGQAAFGRAYAAFFGHPPGADRR
ncbi:AraC family transcriptional regulator [Tistrella mobilis]|jgi:AraC-like DNA-binding protein|uniref:AraC family transcriptional regulator n=1 Tax=Tistrella mobilis TaxID=171437 RepID=UPI003557D873